MSKPLRQYPVRGPLPTVWEPAPITAKDTGDFTTSALKLRQYADSGPLRNLESGFEVKGIPAPLPMYKCYFDDNLSLLWTRPGKLQHLHKLGFLDSAGEIVDIHERRRGYAMAERDIRMAAIRGEERARDKERDAKKAQVVALRQQVTEMRMREIAQTRELRRAKKLSRMGVSLSHSTGSLPL
mmetsp:Transcript_76326/g.220553  ORF Transcript_76326/g.220553 Transcript_76326/m.220553 type:complete len:183 (-) Transcript_76326:103-651(-)